MKSSLIHSKILKYCVSAVFLAVATVVGLSISSPTSHNHASAATVASLNPLTISSVSTLELQQVGVVLYQPTTTTTAFSAAQADSAVNSIFGANSAQGTVLATVSGVWGTTQPTTFWVVSVMPPGGIPAAGGGPIPQHGQASSGVLLTWSLEFVDPTTGVAEADVSGS